MQKRIGNSEKEFHEKLTTIKEFLEQYWTENVIRLMKAEIADYRCNSQLYSSSEIFSDLEKLHENKMMRESLYNMIPKNRSSNLDDQLKLCLSRKVQDMWEVNLETYLDSEFIYNEKLIQEEIGLEIFNKMNEIAEEYKNRLFYDGEEKVTYYKDLFDDVINTMVDTGEIDEILDVVNIFGEEICNEKSDKIVAFVKDISKYLAGLSVLVEDIISDEKELVLKNGLLPYDIWSRNEIADSIFSKKFHEYDNKYWECLFIKQYKIATEKIEIAIDEFKKNIFPHRGIWNVFYTRNEKWYDYIIDGFRKKIVDRINTEEIITIDKKLNTLLGAGIYELSIGNCEENLFCYMWKKYTLKRCIGRIIQDFGLSRFKSCRNLLPCGDTQYFSSDKDVRKVGEIIRNINAEVCRVFDDTDTYNFCDDKKDRLVSLHYDLRSEIEPILGKDKVRANVGKLKIDGKCYVYDKDIAKVIGECAENDNDEFEHKLSKRIRKHENALFQERLLYNNKMRLFLDGKRKLKEFHKIFDIVQFLRQDLTEYESYIIEKKTRVYLAWLIYYRTQMYMDTEEQNKDWVIKVASHLGRILNPGIQLEIADKVLIMTNRILEEKNENMDMYMQCMLDALDSGIENSNKKYKIIFNTLLLTFTSKASKAEGVSIRFNLLREPYMETGLDNLFSEIEMAFNLFYQNNKRRKFINEMYQMELKKLDSANGANQKRYSWYADIYSNLSL